MDNLGESSEGWVHNLEKKKTSILAGLRTRGTTSGGPCCFDAKNLKPCFLKGVVNVGSEMEGGEREKFYFCWGEQNQGVETLYNKP